MRFWDHPDHLFARSALAVAAIVCVAPAMAQNTTSAIAGRVVDDAGRPVAGAQVNIRHVESGTGTTATTDSDGRYTARGLRPGGPYTITVSAAGRTERQEGVILALAETLALETRLAPAAQQIVVTGRANNTIDRSAMGAGTNLGSRELQALASIQRSLQDYARTDPRIAQTDKERGEISAGGQNTRFNSITIDGVTTNDTFGLEANNLPTIKQPISIDAIQTVQVNLSNYDVTQRGYTGANINAVTKSGTNELAGSVYYVWRNADYVGQRYNRATDAYFPAPAFKEYTVGTTVGGPIVKDRLFFFASYEELKSSRNSPTFGPLGSSLTNVGITQSAIDQAIAIAGGYGIAAGTSQVPQGLQVSVKDTLLKLDWNISDSHRANVRYTKTEQEEPQLNGFTTTGLSLSSWWFNQTKTLETLVGQWFADWTADLSTELKLSKRDYDSVPIVPLRAPAIGLRFSGALPAGTPSSVNANNRFLNFGTENSRHFNELRTETTDIYAGATWNLGGHELKFGVDYSDNKVFNAFLQNIFGNYTFGCENATATFTYNTVPNVDCSAMTPAQRDQAVLENFQRGRISSYTLQLPRTGRTINDAVAVWSIENTGLFLQDAFSIGRNLRLMVGVRVDKQGVPTKPIANAAAAAPRVAGTADALGNVTTRDTGGFGLDNTITLDGDQLVQPRLGFNWNLGSRERPMQLRGGLGLFQGAAANVWLSNPFSNTGAAVTTFSCTTAGTCASVPFNPNANTQTAPAGQTAANIDFISSGLEQPSVWKANLAFETELPALPVVGRLTVGAEWLHTKVNSSLYYRHLNLGANTRTGSDGRQLFWTRQAYDQACWSGSNLTSTGATCTGARDRALSNASFGRNVLIADKTEKGGGDVITLSVGQPANAAGVAWSLAYTRTTAKEMSPLTSSTSASNWSNRNIFNPNEEVLQNSNYLTKDRISASLSFARNLLSSKHRTTLGVFYEGRRGKPYSWTYINDLNGDGISGNDLMYIPSAPGSNEVVFRGGAAEEARFWDTVNAYSALSSAKGGVVGRNNQFAGWVNNFDVRFSQELPGFMKNHKATFTFDILNFGNLLNKRWGRIDEIGFPSNRSFVNYNGLDAQGRYIYSLGSLEDLTTRQATGESQWALQITLRYQF
jgi:hypothetical protein